MGLSKKGNLRAEHLPLNSNRLVYISDFSSHSDLCGEQPATKKRRAANSCGIVRGNEGWARSRLEHGNGTATVRSLSRRLAVVLCSVLSDEAGEWGRAVVERIQFWVM